MGNKITEKLQIKFHHKERYKYLVLKNTSYSLTPEVVTPGLVRNIGIKAKYPGKKFTSLKPLKGK